MNQITKKPKHKITPRCLRSGDAADYIGISRRHLFELTKQGRLPYHKLGTRLHVFRISDLDAFLESTRIGGEAANV